MISSIFSSEYLRKYSQLPASEKLWHACLAVSFTLVFAVGCWLTGWFWQGDNDRLHRDLARQSLSDETEVVFVGTSHTERDVRPDLFRQNVMNVSSNLLDYRCAELVLEHNLHLMPNVKVVVLEMDYVLLQYDTFQSIDGCYKIFEGWEVDFHDPRLGRLFAVQAAVQKLPIFRYRRLTPVEILWKQGPRDRADAVAGYLPSDNVMSEKNNGRARASMHRQDANGDVLANRRALLRIIRSLSQRQIRVVLMRYPHHELYFQSVPPQFEEDYQESLRAAYRQGYVSRRDYWDFGKLPFLEDSDFQDGDHLNSSGAKKFARFLDARLDEYLSQKNGT